MFHWFSLESLDKSHSSRSVPPNDFFIMPTLESPAPCDPLQTESQLMFGKRIRSQVQWRDATYVGRGTLFLLLRSARWGLGLELSLCGPLAPSTLGSIGPTLGQGPWQILALPGP